MKLSINPTYACNFRCNFCYLGEKLADTTILPLNILQKRLEEIVSYGHTIDYVDLYGGEVAILAPKYLYEMHDMLSRYYGGPINVITNLSRVNPFFLEDYVDLSVSYDFDCRERSDLVFQNMLKASKDIHVLLLASQCLITKNVDYMIDTLNFLQNVTSVEIKPYSTNQDNQQNVSFRQYEEFVKAWIQSPIPKNFLFVNETNIQETLSKTRNSFSNDHVYITPYGKFGVLEFDLNDNEFFLELDSYDDYINWTKIEQTRVVNNQYCKQCKYLGHCLSEHLRDVKTLDQSCNGFKFLIEWYENERISN